MQSGPSRDIDGEVDSWRDEVCNKRSATRLAVRARGAGAAGQDQVVDELALSNLIYGRSINQDFFAAAPRGRCRLFLLPLQFMFDGAGGAGDDGHRDEQTRRGHRNLLFAYDSRTRLRAAAAITIFLARWRAGGGGDEGYENDAGGPPQAIGWHQQREVPDGPSLIFTNQQGRGGFFIKGTQSVFQMCE